MKNSLPGDIESMEGDPALERMNLGTTAEAVERLVATNPERHNTPLAERLRRARQASDGGDWDAWDRFNDERIREAGGDPAEMLPGNKPRYTVDDDGAVKDHETGAIILSDAGGKKLPSETVESGAETTSPVGQTTTPPQCGDEDHVWQEPVEADTPCKFCGLSFEKWVNA